MYTVLRQWFTTWEAEPAWSKYNAFKVKLAARNSVYLNYKNMPLPQLVLNAAPLALGMAVKRGFLRKSVLRRNIWKA